MLSAEQENTNNVNNTKKHIKPPPKPEEESYKAALEEVKNKIDKLQDELNDVNAKINNNSDNGPADNKREELMAQLDKLRGKQAEIRKTRSNTFEKLKIINESLQKKKRDLKQSKDNVQFRTVKDIDSAIAKLERQIESGTLKIIEEKKIVANISNLQKSKKSVKQFEIQQIAIDDEQKAIDELKKTLDDSDFKKNNEEYDDIKVQLDAINKDYASDREKRNELYDERKKLRDQINEQIANRRAIQEQHNKAKQEYRKYQEEDYKRRQELKRKQAEEREIQYKKEAIARKREEAAIPAFQSEILDCENLANYFNSLNGGTGKSAQQPSPPTTPFDSNIRQPDATSNIPEGTILMKKSDRDDDYFIGGGKKHKKSQKEKKSGKNNGFQFPISIIEQLNSVNVAVPLNSSEIEQTIESLTQKKKYFIENQDRVTKENIEKVEAEIAATEVGHYHKKKGNNNGKNNNNNNNNNDDDDNNNNEEEDDKNENENGYSTSVIAVSTKGEEKGEGITATENEKEATAAIDEPKEEKIGRNNEH